MVYHIIIYFASHNPSHQKSSLSPVIFPPPVMDADDPPPMPVTHLRCRRPTSGPLAGHLPPVIFSLFPFLSLLLSPAVTHLRPPTTGPSPGRLPATPPFSLLFSLSPFLSLLLSHLLTPFFFIITYSVENRIKKEVTKEKK